MARQIGVASFVTRSGWGDTKFPHALSATWAFPNQAGKQGIWCALRYIFGSRTPGIRSAYAAPPNPSASSSGRISHSQLLVDGPSACCVASGVCSVVRGTEPPGLVAGTEVAADCFADGSAASVVRAADTSDEVAGTTVTVDSFAEVVVRAAE